MNMNKVTGTGFYGLVRSSKHCAMAIKNSAKRFPRKGSWEQEFLKLNVNRNRLEKE